MSCTPCKVRGVWELRPVEESAVGRLAEALGVLPVTARCLLARGVDGIAITPSDPENQAGLLAEERLDPGHRGFGLLGFPGRVGMPPEITELTLRKG